MFEQEKITKEQYNAILAEIEKPADTMLTDDDKKISELEVLFSACTFRLLAFVMIDNIQFAKFYLGGYCKIKDNKGSPMIMISQSQFDSGIQPFASIFYNAKYEWIMELIPYVKKLIGDRQFQELIDRRDSNDDKPLDDLRNRIVDTQIRMIKD